MTVNKFKLNLPDWKNCTKETAEFFFNQAKDFLAETVKSFEQVRDRAMSYIGIYMSILVVITAYFINALFKEDFTILFQLSGISILFLVFATFKMLQVIAPMGLWITGSEPKTLIRNEYVDQNIPKETQYIRIVLGECQSYQDRITNNLLVNEILMNRMRLSIKTLYLMILVLLTYSLLSFFHCC